MKTEQRKDSGVAMIVVLCAGALLLALSAALAYSISLMSASADKQILNERSYQLAKSFSEVLEADLCAAEGTGSGSEKTGDTPGTTPEERDGFYGYAKKFMEEPSGGEETEQSRELKISGEEYNDPGEPYGSTTVRCTRKNKYTLEVSVQNMTSRDRYTYTTTYTYRGGKFTRKWLKE